MRFQFSKNSGGKGKEVKAGNKADGDPYIASMIGWAIIMPCVLAAVLVLAR